LAAIAPGAAVEVVAIGPLRTARMTLRTLVAADREAYLEAVRATRADLDRYIALYREGERDEEMFERQLAASNHASAAAESLRLVGVLEDGGIAGGFNLNGISRGLEWKGDLTWWVAAGVRGQGLAVEGVRALAEHALEDLPRGLGLHAVQAWITEGNVASVRVAERAGFRRAEERSYLQTGERWAIHECWVRRAGTEPAR
jgi:RimJ/RimL family protein N-acetyltransferase